MVSVGSVTVDVLPDASRFNDTLSAKLTPAAAKAGDEFGKRFADSVQARLRAADPTLKLDTDTRAAAAQVDQFVADTDAKVKAASSKSGDDSGSLLAQGMRNGVMRKSPLIAAGIAGALAAGAPAVIAGAGLLFGGVAAAAVHANQQVDQAAHDAMNAWEDAARNTAQVTVPWFSSALGRLGQLADDLRPQLGQAFGALEAPIDSLTTGLVGMIRNVMPGLVAAVRAAGPVFQGLADLMARIGTGLGDFFQIIAQHGQAAGQAFSAIGQIVQELLPILGTLLGEGAELASRVLPPLADVLGLVARALQAIAPVLPAVVTGFIAMKAASGLSNIVGGLAGKISNLGTVGAVAGGSLSKLGTAIPVVGAVVAVAGSAMEIASQQVTDWANALLKGGNAAAQAKDQMQALAAGWKTLSSADPATQFALPFANAMGVGTNAMKASQDQADKLRASMSPLQRAQQDVTAAQNEYLTMVQKYGASSGQAVGAAADLRDKEDALKGTQDQLNSVTSTASSVTGELKGQLQTTADTASAANTQISLLKGSLDALTGKAVSMGDAQVAVTNATNAAEQAMAAQKDSAGHLTSALTDSTGAIDLNTAAGAAAWQALTALASTDNAYISTMEKHGATTDRVTQKDAQLRDSFIKSAEKMGFSAGEAQNLANQIYGIPAQRNVQINTNAADATAAIGTLQQQIDNLHGRNVTIAILSAGNAGPAAYAVPGSGTGGLATGGVIPGYAPGVDSVHALLSPGEGVLVPEAVRGLGGSAGIQALNAAFSSRVPRFADGGVVGSVPVNIHETAQPFNDAMQAAANKLRDQMAAAFAPGAPTNVQGNAAIVQAMAAARGWTGAEWNALYALVMRESGFRNTAQNPTSTAYGMFQFLNSTWAAYGGGKTSDPAAQTRMGLDYIAGRYRDPLGAWAHETKFGWYDQGGLIPPGPSLVYNGTGQSELVAPAQTFKQVVGAAAGGGGPTLVSLRLDGPATTALMEGHAVTVVASYSDALDQRSRY